MGSRNSVTLIIGGVTLWRQLTPLQANICNICDICVEDGEKYRDTKIRSTPSFIRRDFAASSSSTETKSIFWKLDKSSSSNKRSPPSQGCVSTGSRLWTQPCEDNLPKLSIKYNFNYQQQGKLDGLGTFCHPLLHNALALLLSSVLRGQSAGCKTQLSQL